MNKILIIIPAECKSFLILITQQPLKSIKILNVKLALQDTLATNELADEEFTNSDLLFVQDMTMTVGLIQLGMLRFKCLILIYCIIKGYLIKCLNNSFKPSLWNISNIYSNIESIY